MAAEQEKLREKQRAHGALWRRLTLPWSRSRAVEMEEIDPVFLAAESKAPVEPSLEQWTKFNERLMQQVQQQTPPRPLSQRWRKVMWDRFRASDWRWKDKTWLVLGVVLLAVAVALIYLRSR